LADAFVFLLWFDTGFDFVNPELSGDSAGGAFVIPGEHNDFETEFVQLIDGGGGRVLDRVRNRDNPGRAAIDSDEDRSLSLLL
jgi:hypothetical protein